jgi:hypothetical protein
VRVAVADAAVPAVAQGKDVGPRPQTEQLRSRRRQPPQLNAETIFRRRLPDPAEATTRNCLFTRLRTEH